MTNGRLFGVGLTLLLISLATLAWLVRTPFEMTRLRNALISEVGVPDDFAWRPGNEPDDFHRETREPPPEFMRFTDAAKQLAAPLALSLDSSLSRDDEVNRTRQSGKDEVAAFQRAATLGNVPPKGYRLGLSLGRNMTQGSVTQGNPIQSNTRDTYRRIVEDNEGYCSDFTQVFNGLALAAGLPVREWGMSFDGFSGDGHAFSDVYDADLGKWVFVDTFNSFYVVDTATQEPLSVLEFRERLESGDATLVDGVRYIDREAFGMKDAATAIAYYTRGAAQFFLWFGNDVFSYDADPIVKKAAGLGRSVEQAVAILIGAHPRLRIYPTPEAAPYLAKLSRARWLFGGAFTLGVIACCTFAFALIRGKRRRLSQGNRVASTAR